jgi:hypothetical protein
MQDIKYYNNIKINSMVYLAIGMILTGLWITFEIWKAPLLRENPDGSWTTIRKEKKIMDFFKKKTKRQ